MVNRRRKFWNSANSYRISSSVDLNIPKISGYTVLALYPPKKQKTPVVVFSASDNEVDVSSAFSLGAQDFIHKPMDLDEYKTAVSLMILKWVPSEESGATIP
jgi:DNA-binding response OmpR family regulator